MSLVTNSTHEIPLHALSVLIYLIIIQVFSVMNKPLNPFHQLVSLSQVTNELSFVYYQVQIIIKVGKIVFRQM
ncbi:unnamed protein product [Paramecium octaurelia]|uniref:Uncharacterized protein n=1 Tax=Paramecium octaurelia TaxID=43137 RepID=A0A8S1VYL0_PAROT|nr:unnamed protein product [Paramecium octaurelia]